MLTNAKAITAVVVFILLVGQAFSQTTAAENTTTAATTMPDDTTGTTATTMITMDDTTPGPTSQVVQTTVGPTTAHNETTTQIATTSIITIERTSEMETTDTLKLTTEAIETTMMSSQAFKTTLKTTQALKPTLKSTQTFETTMKSTQSFETTMKSTQSFETNMTVTTQIPFTPIITIISNSMNITSYLETNNQTVDNLLEAVLNNSNAFSMTKIQSFVSGRGGQILLRSALSPNQLGPYAARINAPEERKALFYSTLLNIHLNENNATFLTNMSDELARTGTLSGEKFLPDPEDPQLLALACSSNTAVSCTPTVVAPALNVGLIVGVSIGGAFLLLLIVALVCYCCSKSKSETRVTPDNRGSMEMSSSAPYVRNP
uniref:uncharacterized protein LOC100187354 isoform X2 n=1 Tax=Ciona intestinalis TaxID=7719 RepID=UPI000180BFF9|nr:uncharacterized protein LOC100187354 isoform X2 [Ciona intestinalis]|eukprot:XP_002127648.1 uncharacterized protein LOC100187354 isoform X2 [Ciona intestinalis]